MRPTLPNQSPIYSIQNPFTTLSLAWNLVKQNLKTCLITMLGPSVLLAASGILINAASSTPFLTKSTVGSTAITLTGLISGILIWFAGIVYWGFSCCTLTRLFYSCIIDAECLSIRDCWAHTKKAWPSLSLTLIILFVVLALFIFLDFLILFAGGILTGVSFKALQQFLHSSNTLLNAVMTTFFMLLWGFIVLVILVSLSSIQYLSFMFPITALSTQYKKNTSWWQQVSKSYRLLFSNLPNLVVFGIVLFLFVSLLSTVMHGPLLIWLGFELTRLNSSVQHTLPVHIQIIFNLWNSFVFMLLTPMSLSAITLAWYDCQVRKEGMDLKLWLRQILQRHKQFSMDSLLKE